MGKDKGLDQVEKIKYYKSVFGSPLGKEVLYDLMKTHFVLSPSYAPGTPTDQAIFNEGQRNVVLRILSLLKIDPRKMEDAINRQIKLEDNQ